MMKPLAKSGRMGNLLHRGPVSSTITAGGSNRRTYDIFPEKHTSFAEPH
jgi:hypothetical protein